jgi:c-di-GMP-binding flagellar brake protein YcgR
VVRRQRSAAERRRFARVAEDVVVGCNPLARPALEARTLNFSAGGVLFLAPEPLEAGSHVALRLQLPGETEEVAFEARVVRVRTRSNTSHEVAAEFVGGDAASQRSLLAFIESKAGYQPDPFPRISA